MGSYPIYKNEPEEGLPVGSGKVSGGSHILLLHISQCVVTESYGVYA